MQEALNIPKDILRAAYAHARATFPDECCGWLVGPKGGDAVTGIRPCQNHQAEHRQVAYMMSADDQMEFASSFRTDLPARIIFHSHPNSTAYFSSVDVRYATSPWGDGPAAPVQQLVVGLDEDRISSAAMFAWSYDENAFVGIARFGGVEI